MSASFVTSAVTNVTSPASGCAGSLRAQATTEAPSATSRSTTTAPMPMLAPVTTATRPANRSFTRAC